MNCFVCATPYHLIASVVLASGSFCGSDSTLVLLDHFAVEEDMLARIRSTGVFKEVILYKSNNKSLWNKVKRFTNVFFPDKTVRYLANETRFDHCIFFALDYLNLGYIAKSYRKRGIECEFAFGDDGIGTYVDANCYAAKPLVKKLLKLTGRLADEQAVKTLYVFKPELMVENTHYQAKKILQNGQVFEKVRRAVSEIFQFGQTADISGKILYFEQLSGPENEDPNWPVEQRLLRKAEEILQADSVVKMHPRSTGEALWKDFAVLKTRIPFEAMALEECCKPRMIMSNNSTAMITAYLLDGLPVSECPAVFLCKLLPAVKEDVNAAMERCFQILKPAEGESMLYVPQTEEELQTLLQKLAEK